MWSKVISQVTGPYRYFCIDTLRALDTKVRPRFDGDRVYVHDSIVLTVIGGSTHVTHSMFVTFWRDKRDSCAFISCPAGGTLVWKPCKHDMICEYLWCILIHDTCATLNLRSAAVHCRIALKNLPGDYISMTSRAFRWIVSKPSGFSNDSRTSKSCWVAGPCGCYLLQLSGMGRPHSLPCIPCFFLL